MSDETMSLNERYVDREVDSYFNDINNDYENKCIKALNRYKENKNSNIGTTIKCAWCGKRIIKKSYQTQFCSNKGKNNCKDKYHNNTNETRRFRAQLYN
jgi:hypothetical protein